MSRSDKRREKKCCPEVVHARLPGHKKCKEVTIRDDMKCHDYKTRKPGCCKTVKLPEQHIKVIASRGRDEVYVNLKREKHHIDGPCVDVDVGPSEINILPQKFKIDVIEQQGCPPKVIINNPKPHCTIGPVKCHVRCAEPIVHFACPTFEVCHHPVEDCKKPCKSDSKRCHNGGNVYVVEAQQQQEYSL